MKITRVDICGFKSFVDHTSIHIDHEITAIVGPNGCGKSNVVDAIRWAMGEQSAKNMRGKTMEDVIFNGSENRSAHPFAEVTLTFDNTAGDGPEEYKDYTELAVTRKLGRDGTREYLINKTPVRLMDVTQLFLGTGIGARAYSIIEQGRVGYIVSAKPEDRRNLIEEAAGITKFKVKKRAAERKIELTKQNLDRVNDILNEIDKNLANLKRQAQKAERYRAYKDELRDLDLWQSSHAYLQLVSSQSVISHQKLEDQQALEACKLEVEHFQHQLNATKETLGQAESEKQLAQEKLFDLSSKLQDVGAQLLLTQQRKDTLVTQEAHHRATIESFKNEGALLNNEHGEIALRLADLIDIETAHQDQLEKERLELEKRKTDLEECFNTLERAKARCSEAEHTKTRAETVLASFEKRRLDVIEREHKMKRELDTLFERATMLAEEMKVVLARQQGLQGNREATASEREALETSTQAKKDLFHHLDKVLEEKRAEVAKKRSRLRSIEELQEKFEGVGAGVRSLMTHYGQDELQRKEKGIVGLVADLVECPADLTQALAAVLEDKLQWVVVENEEVAMDALQWIASQERGRITVLHRSMDSSRPTFSIPPSQEGVIGRLADMVTYNDQDASWVRSTIGDTVVVNTMHIAMDLHKQGYHAHIVTLDGAMVSPIGAITSGKGDDVGAHLIALKREMRELALELGTKEDDLTRMVDEHSTLRTQIAEGQAALEAARTSGHEAELSLLRAEQELKQFTVELEHNTTRRADIATEITTLQTSLQEHQAEESLASLDINRNKELLAETLAEKQSLEETYAEKKSLWESQNSKVSDLRVQFAQSKERADADRNTIARVQKSIVELELRITNLTAECAKAQELQGEMLSVGLNLNMMSEQIALEKALAEATLSQKTEAMEQERSRVATVEDAQGEIRARLESLQQSLGNASLSMQRVSMELEHLVANVHERHKTDLRHEIGSFHDREQIDDVGKNRITELARLIERMGEVNLSAVTEYEEQNKRFTDLNTQKLDLEESLASLDKAIKQMNKESRRLFKETFHAVNERFKQIFPRMFGGGKAELLLTNPDDLLETGVEIVAQPPGKKLGALELMSGGEKALTAVSLIFSIFQHRPSPFCILDEVDAPLDEANIGRFCEGIRAMTGHSQFIVITHSKRTMQNADVLYGVTMENPGVSKLVSVELKKSQAKRMPEMQETAVA